MRRYLLAVLIRHTATIEGIDTHLGGPMRPMLRSGLITGYRLGGTRTGAWDPDYDPTSDPRNWRPCDTCGGSTRLGAGRCTVCAAAADVGRDPGTVLRPNAADWAAHPGDIVPLPTLLDPGWRYPEGHTPQAWVDLAGTVWLDWLDSAEALPAGADTGRALLRLRTVFEDLHAGRRRPDPAAPRSPRGGFDATRWSVAVVDAHH